MLPDFPKAEGTLAAAGVAAFDLTSFDDAKAKAEALLYVGIENTVGEFASVVEHEALVTGLEGGRHVRYSSMLKASAGLRVLILRMRMLPS